MQPNKSSWLVGSKGDSTYNKKESWTNWKTIQEKNKEASSDSETSERGIVHASRISTIVGARISGSVVNSNDDDNELPPSLGITSLAKRECCYLVAWEVLQALGFKVSRLECLKRALWAWNPRCRFYTQACGWETTLFFGCVVI